MHSNYEKNYKTNKFIVMKSFKLFKLWLTGEMPDLHGLTVARLVDGSQGLSKYVYQLLTPLPETSNFYTYIWTYLPH